MFLTSSGSIPIAEEFAVKFAIETDQRLIFGLFDQWLVVAQNGSNGVIAIAAVVIGLLLGAGGVILFNQLRSRELQAKADGILEQAKVDAANLVRSGDVDAKEAALKQK